MVLLSGETVEALRSSGYLGGDGVLAVYLTTAIQFRRWIWRDRRNRQAVQAEYR
jgi:hypothetical protein